MLRLFYLAIGADVGLVMTNSVVKTLLDSEGARPSFFQVPCSGRVPHPSRFLRRVRYSRCARTALSPFTSPPSPH
jgi:hypothetical protein